MKRSRTLRKGTAVLLAAGMVFTMLAPAVPAYAESAASKIFFDTGEGPAAQFAYADGQSGEQPTVDGKIGLTGTAYTLIKDAYPELKMFSPGAVGDRPALPGLADDWTGYKPELNADDNIQWYEPDGYTKRPWLPYAFQSGDVQYQMKWVGDPQKLYAFMTKDQLTLPLGGTKEYSRSSADTIAASTVTGFAKNIPGFKVSGTANVPANGKKYDGTAGRSTGEFDSQNHSFTGTMPNEDLTLTYTYAVDDSKQFNAIAKYVKEDGSKVANDSAPVAAKVGGEFTLSPAAVPGYTVESAEITSGTEENETDRILSLADVNASVPAPSTSGPFTANMPNQDVIVTYKYKWANEQKTVNVRFIGPDGTQIKSVPVTYTPDQATGVAAQEVVIDYKDAAGQPLKGIQDQVNASVDDTVPGTDIHFNNADITIRPDKESTGALRFKAGLVGGNITITYVADVTDDEFYSSVTFARGEHGNLVGISSTQRKAKGAYEFAEQTQEQQQQTGQTWGSGLTADVVVMPDQGYRFAGWKLGTPGGAPQGALLKGSFELARNITLVPIFEKDPDQWADLTFNVINGTVDQSSVSALVGTQVTVTAMAQPNTDQATYTFAGWFDGPEQATRVEGAGTSFTISVEDNASHMYTAKFSNNATQDLAPQIPNVSGVIDSSGNGKIRVDGALEDRTYVITDADGIIVAVRTGAQLKNHNDFGKLTPGTSYRAYETKLVAAVLQVGEAMPFDPDTVSVPRNLTIGAVGGNVQVLTDPDNADKAQILVKPAAENTVYSLVDSSGSPVTGWITPQGSPGQAAFDGLEQGELYTVVAVPAAMAESTAPTDRLAGGVQVAADLPNTPDVQYQIRITGGTVVSVDGTVVNDTSAQAAVGALVKVAADDNGMKWTALMGKVPPGAERQKSFTFDMPKSNVILVAAPETGTPSDAVKVTSKVAGSGQVSLDPDQLDKSREAMSTETDKGLIQGGKKIAYEVTFKKYTPIASVSDAAKEVAPNKAAYQADWAIDVSAARTDERGITRPVGADYAGYVYAITQVDASALGNDGYNLCEIDSEGTAAISDQFADNTGGLVRFKAKVGCTYVLGYNKQIEVTLKDDKRAGEYLSKVLRVNKGDKLLETEAYRQWEPSNNQTATNSGYYDYKGLSKRANHNNEYVDEAVDKRLTLYAWYEMNPEWKAARDKLEELINGAAHRLLGSGNISREDRDRLQDAVNAALYQISPTSGENSASAQELDGVYDDLDQLITDITGSEPQPPNPGGGHSSGGSSSSSGGSSAGRSYSGTPGGAAAYRAGTDGNWELLDAASHKWAFGLNSGKQLSGGWHRIMDAVNGQTNTGWYNFADDHTMRDGWITDMGKWYYLNQKHDGWFGRMVTGWHYEDSDHRWYYLDQTGAMVTGWQTIDGKSYYFSESSAEPTWQYNQSTGVWEYANLSARPYGSMYVGERTPDGHTVDQNGVAR